MLITPSGVQLTGNHPGLIIACAGKADSASLVWCLESEAGSLEREEAQSGGAPPQIRWAAGVFVVWGGWCVISAGLVV